MKKMHLFALLVGLCLSFQPTNALAHHEKDEPSDGTVDSFRSFKNPKVPEIFNFTGPGDKRTNLAAFKGKVLLVNIWATWCPPCVHELPALNRLQKRFQDKPFKIIPLATDRKRKAYVERVFTRLNLDALDLYLDPWNAAETAFPLDVLPANFIIGPDGKALAYLRSAVDWDSPDADKMINRYLKQTEPLKNKIYP